jgi:hypothetical protein
MHGKELFGSPAGLLNNQLASRPFLVRAAEPNCGLKQQHAPLICADQFIP